MSLKFKLLAVAILINLALPNTGLADRRNFLWSYEAKTMAKGETELEQYFTTDVDKSETDTNYRLTHEHQIEVEYGITDNFDVGIYQIFRQREGEGFSYRGYKTRGRYRFGEMGQYFFDPLIYLEFTHKPTGHEVEFEEKIVLAKSIERLRLAFNMSFEQELKYKTNETLHILEPSFASGIQITRWFLAGIEMEGNHH